MIFLVLVVFDDNAKDALVQGGDNVTADSLCTYIASGQRSRKGMCPGLARQYFFMPDTETFIKCTTLLPVPPFHILSECVYVPQQVQVVCRDEHISSLAAIFVLIGGWPETSIYPFYSGEEAYTQESRFNLQVSPKMLP